MAIENLSAEVERQIAAISGMTLAEVRAMLVKYRTDILEGHLTPDEGNALNRAATERVQTIKNEISR